MWKFFGEDKTVQKTWDDTDNSKFELLGPVGEKLSNPRCISVSETGEFVVSDPDSCFVVIYNSSGIYMSHFSTLPKQNFYFFLDIERYKPHDVAWLSSRKIVYTQPKGCKINVSDWKGKTSVCVEGRPLYEPYGICVDKSDTIFVTDCEKGRLLCYNCDGKLIKSIGVFGSGNLLLNNPHFITVSKNGNIYINDVQKGKVIIHVYKQNKNHCNTIQTNIEYKGSVGQLSTDNDDKILQVNTNDSCIDVFTSEYSETNDCLLYPISKIHITDDPCGITFDNKGDLVCIDQKGKEVKILPWKYSAVNGTNKSLLT